MAVIQQDQSQDEGIERSSWNQDLHTHSGMSMKGTSMACTAQTIMPEQLITESSATSMCVIQEYEISSTASEVRSFSLFVEPLASTIIGSLSGAEEVEETPWDWSLLPLLLSPLLLSLLPSMNQVDLIFRRTLLFSRFFTHSWGRPDALKRMKYFRDNYMAKGAVMELIEQRPPKMIVTKREVSKDMTYMEGYFLSPLAEYAPELFEENVAKASWCSFFPAVSMGGFQSNGVVVHLASTGDHSYFRRRYGLANDLLKQGISSILLENPFYGSRKPKDQFRSSLHNVCDLFVMGGSLMAECCFLLKWMQDEFDQTLLGLSGVSMGGHMACLAATNMIKPVVLVPCLSGVSAAPIFTLGALSHAINWPVLKKELESEQFRQAINEIPGCDWIDRVEQDPMLTELFESKEKRLMWILMDYFTSLVEYPVPCEPKLVKSIVAEEDAYVLNHERIPDLTDIWPGANVQIVEKMGHVQGYLMNHHLFRQAIVDKLKLLSNLQSGLSIEPNIYPRT